MDNSVVEQMVIDPQFKKVLDVHKEPEDLEQYLRSLLGSLEGNDSFPRGETPLTYIWDGIPTMIPCALDKNTSDYFGDTAGTYYQSGLCLLQGKYVLLKMNTHYFTLC